MTSALGNGAIRFNRLYRELQDDNNRILLLYSQSVTIGTLPFSNDCQIRSKYSVYKGTFHFTVDIIRVQGLRVKLGIVQCC